MKRNFIVILALVLALTILTLSVGLVACNDNDEPSVDEKPSDQEYTLPLEDGKKQLTIYWTYPGGVDFATSDIWMWWTGKEGSGYTMHECAYGGKVVVNVPDSIEEVGFIVRVDCSDPGGSAWGTATKDFESDRFAVLTDRSTVIYLKSGDGNQYKSSDGGVTLEQIKLFTIANMMSLHSVSYNVTPKVKIDNINDIKLIEGEREIALKSLSSLGQEVVSGVVETEEELDITKSYKLQIKGYGDKAVVPLGVFGSEEFAEKYNYDGELGAVVKGNTTEFKLWAPTASKVVLNLFQSGNGGSAYQTIEMEKADKGVWLKNIENCGHGTYYTYTVTTSLETQEAVDPYARSAGVNGDRGMVVDLSRTNPDGGIITQVVEKLFNYKLQFGMDITQTRILIIIANMWIGVPYSMLMCSGILMNIPSDLYESAKIDGSGPVRTFFKITLPYMLFVTGPYLITTFIGNINNFNVIYLLSGGNPGDILLYTDGAKGTDLLITWLYKLSLGVDRNYKLASVIGILVFIISAVFSLIVYNRSSAVKKEDDFQ